MAASEGLVINNKRSEQIMADDNNLCILLRRFRKFTAINQHTHFFYKKPVYKKRVLSLSNY